VSETLKGIRRSIGTAQEGKAPLLTSDIRRIVACCPETILGLRDRTFILVGFAGAFRRSELAAIDFTRFEALERCRAKSFRFKPSVLPYTNFAKTSPTVVRSESRGRNHPLSWFRKFGHGHKWRICSSAA